MSAAPERGTQNERTSLAWQRTALAIAGAAAVLARLTFDRLGVWALLALLLTLPAPLAVLLTGRGRYRYRAAPGSHPERRTPWLGGIPPLTLAVAVAVLAAVELTALLVAP